jgi:hypothetical protein
LGGLFVKEPEALSFLQEMNTCACVANTIRKKRKIFFIINYLFPANTKDVHCFAAFVIAETRTVQNQICFHGSMFLEKENSYKKEDSR